MQVVSPRSSANTCWHHAGRVFVTWNFRYVIEMTSCSWSIGYGLRWRSGGMCLGVFFSTSGFPWFYFCWYLWKLRPLAFAAQQRRNLYFWKKCKHLVFQNYTINKHMCLSVLRCWLLVFRSILKRKYGQHSQWFDTEGSAISFLDLGAQKTGSNGKTYPSSNLKVVRECSWRPKDSSINFRTTPLGGCNQLPFLS